MYLFFRSYLYKKDVSEKFSSMYSSSFYELVKKEGSVLELQYTAYL